MEGLAHTIPIRSQRNIAINTIINCREEMMTRKQTVITVSRNDAVKQIYSQENLTRLYGLLDWLMTKPVEEHRISHAKRNVLSVLPRNALTRAVVDQSLPIHLSRKSISRAMLGANFFGVNESTQSLILRISFVISILLGIYSVGMPCWVGEGIQPGMWPVVIGLLGISVPPLTMIETLIRNTDLQTRAVVIFFLGLAGLNVIASIVTTLTLL